MRVVVMENDGDDGDTDDWDKGDACRYYFGVIRDASEWV